MRYLSENGLHGKFEPLSGEDGREEVIVIPILLNTQPFSGSVFTKI
jgi:hypothetical protein